MSAAQLPTFGQRQADAAYQRRPGSYALITRREQLAIVRVNGGTGYDYPGGGAEPGESPLATLHREVLEEIGYRVAVQRELGTAIAYVESQREGHFEKICTFYHCHLLDGTPIPSEEDHVLEWIAIAELRRKMNPTIIHYWALTRLVEKLEMPLAEV